MALSAGPSGSFVISRYGTAAASGQTFEYYAEWWEPISLSPLLPMPPHWVSVQRPLTTRRYTLNPWLALWRFEP